MGASVSERNTEALGVADNNVDTKLARGLEEGKGEQIRNEDSVDLVLLLTSRKVDVLKKDSRGLC